MLNLKQGATLLGLLVQSLSFVNVPNTPDPQNSLTPELMVVEPLLATFTQQVFAVLQGVAPIPPVGTGGDDGAAITTALQGSGVVVLQRGSTYNIATPITMSATPGATLYVNGATLTGAMARTGGTANSVIVAAPTLSGAGNTTCNGAATVGARTLVVTSGAGIANGTFIQLQSNAGTSLTAYYQVISGGTTNTLTLDRPILEPWQNTDTVKPVSVMPRHNNVIGPGTINGNGDNGVSFVGVRRGRVQEIWVDVQNAASGAACLVGGIDLDLGTFDVTVDGCLANGFNLAANADEFTVGIGMASCESCRAVRSAGRHCTTAGILLTNSFSCVVDQCEGADCGGTGAGIAVAGTAATSAGGSTDCVVQNSYSGDNAFGLGCALATRLQVKTVELENCSTRHLDVGTGGVASTDCSFSDVTVNGGAPTTAATLVNSAVVRPSFYRFRVTGITGTAALFNVACDFRLDGLVTDSTNTTTGTVVTMGTGAQDSFVYNAAITLKTVNAATSAFLINNAAGRIYFKNIVVAVGVASDNVFNQQSNCVVELSDVMVTNPGAVATTTGYAAVGASSVLRRNSRVDMTATATPYTLVQSDAGTWVVNGATGVDVTFKEARAGQQVAWAIVTKGGTPNVIQQTIVAATKITLTGIAADTSTDSFRFFD